MLLALPVALPDGGLSPCFYYIQCMKCKKCIIYLFLFGKESQPSGWWGGGSPHPKSPANKKVLMHCRTFPFLPLYINGVKQCIVGCLFLHCCEDGRAGPARMARESWSRDRGRGRALALY